MIFSATEGPLMIHVVGFSGGGRTRRQSVNYREFNISIRLAHVRKTGCRDKFFFPQHAVIVVFRFEFTRMINGQDACVRDFFFVIRFRESLIR